MVAAGAREHDREPDGTEHEDDRRVRGEPGEEVGCTARPEGCLRTLPAESSGEIGRFALLEEDDADEKERDNNVDDNEKNDHRSCFVTSWIRRRSRKNVWIGAEEGT